MILEARHVMLGRHWHKGEHHQNKQGLLSLAERDKCPAITEAIRGEKRATRRDVNGI